MTTGLGRHEYQRLKFLPAKPRRAIKASIDRWGELSSGIRMLPDFLVAGSQRCGTSALYEYLVKHPAIARSTTEEIHYFTHNYHRGLDWYRGHFPTMLTKRYVKLRFGLDLQTGEGTPFYTFHPLALSRIAELMPWVKLIVLLRNPIDRAYSHYHHSRRLGVEPIGSFEEALEAEPERLRGEAERMLSDSGYQSRNLWHFSYVARGMYIEQLERLYSLFRSDRILLLSAEQLMSEPAEVHAQVLRFLGLPRITLSSYPRHNAGKYSPMNPDTRRRLTELFAEPNERLSNLLRQVLLRPAIRVL